MAMICFEIPGRLPGLNEMIEAAKSHYGNYSDMKKNYTDMVAWAALAAKVPKMETVEVTILWVEPDNRRDFDNVCCGAKFVLDGLVRARVLHNDTRRHVRKVSHSMDTDKMNQRVIVYLEEVS
jgi:hypothetical protein